MRGKAKAKITISLEQELLAKVDKAVMNHEAPSRSAIMEEALKRWEKERKHRSLDLGVEEYYKSLTSREHLEDNDWTHFTGEHAVHHWKE